MTGACGDARRPGRIAPWVTTTLSSLPLIIIRVDDPVNGHQAVDLLRGASVAVIAALTARASRSSDLGVRLVGPVPQMRPTAAMAEEDFSR